MQEVTFRMVADLDSTSRMRAKIDLEEIGSGELNFELSARLINPHGHELVGLLDVESPLPGSENMAERFSLHVGTWQPLGRWRLTTGRDELIINAEIEPRMPEGAVTFEFHAFPIQD
ncbi:MAG: hypothetical protein R3F46_13150 [bacterium]